MGATSGLAVIWDLSLVFFLPKPQAPEVTDTADSSPSFEDCFHNQIIDIL
jgi:hypothetical protein